MPEQLQVTVVTRNGRISLGKKAMRALGVEEGQRLQIVKDEYGVRLAPVPIPGA